MRPMPKGKIHGIIRSVKVKAADLGTIADTLKIPKNKRKHLRAGDTVHLIREAKPEEILPE